MLFLFLTLGCGLFDKDDDDEDDEEDEDEESSGDSDTDTDTGASITITMAGGSCTEATCEWAVEASGEFGNVTLELIQTGDPGFSCGPDKEVVCGVWMEEHTGFRPAPCEGAGADCVRKELVLDAVSSPSDQVNGSTTLFDSPDEIRTTSWLFMVSDTSGAFVGCERGGHDPGYFSERCPG